MKKLLFIGCSSLLLLFAGCKKETPDNVVIPEKKLDPYHTISECTVGLNPSGYLSFTAKLYSTYYNRYVNYPGSYCPYLLWRPVGASGYNLAPATAALGGYKVRFEATQYYQLPPSGEYCVEMAYRVPLCTSGPPNGPDTDYFGGSGTSCIACFDL